MTFPNKECGATKVIVLRSMAKICDPLRLAAPILLTAKVIFRDICDSEIVKLKWDAVEMKRRWEKWLKNSPISIHDAKINTYGKWNECEVDTSWIY